MLMDDRCLPVVMRVMSRLVILQMLLGRLAYLGMDDLVLVDDEDNDM